MWRGDHIAGLLIGISDGSDDQLKLNSFDLTCLESISQCISLYLEICGSHGHSEHNNGLQTGHHDLLNTFATIYDLDDTSSLLSIDTTLNVNTQNLLEHTLSNAYKLLGADKISLFLRKSKSDLQCVASSDIKGLTLSSTSGLLGYCYTNKETINTTDPKSDARFNQDVDKQVGYTTTSLLTTPLVGLDDMPYGVLQAVNKLEKASFTKEDEAILTEISKQISLQICSLQYQSFAQRYMQLLNHIKIISSFYSSTNDIAPFIDGSNNSEDDKSSSILTEMEKLCRSICNCEEVHFYRVIGDSYTSFGVQNADKHSASTSSTTLDTYSHQHQSQQGNAYEFPQKLSHASNKVHLMNVKKRRSGNIGNTVITNVSEYITDSLRTGTLKEYNYGYEDSRERDCTGNAGVKSANDSAQDKSSSSTSTSPRLHPASSVLPHDIANCANALVIPLTHLKMKPISSSNASSPTHMTTNSSTCSYNSGSVAASKDMSEDDSIWNSTSSSCEVDLIIITKSINNKSSSFQNIEKEGMRLLCQLFANRLETIRVNSQYKSTLTSQNNQITLLNTVIQKYSLYSLSIGANGNIISYSKGTELFFNLTHYDMKLLRYDAIVLNSRLGPGTSSATNKYNTGNGTEFRVETDHNGKFLDDISTAMKTSRDVTKLNAILDAFGNEQSFCVNYSITCDANNYHSSDTKSDEQAVLRGPLRVPSASSMLLVNADKNNNIASNSKIYHVIIQVIGPTEPAVSVSTSPTTTDTPTYKYENEKTSSSITCVLSGDSSAKNNGSDHKSPENSKIMVLKKGPSVDPAGKSELANIDLWEFDVLKISSKEYLYASVFACFEKYVNFDEIDISRTKFAQFIVEVDESYHNNAFHNFYHALSVTHFTHMLIGATNGKSCLSQLNLFAIMFSALVHDVDHPGNTNVFEINKGTELALRYNDVSVLENHHCSTAFSILKRPHINLLEQLTVANRNELRKIVISSILATDMSFHLNIVQDMISRVASTASDSGSTPWEVTSMPDKLLYCKILVHAADLSNPVRIFTLAKEWAMKVSEEFNLQGEKERLEGLPVSTYLLTPDTKALAKNEIYFSSQVVAPMWKAMSSLFPATGHLYVRAENNIESWKELLATNS